jgi:hypothetical protein
LLERRTFPLPVAGRDREKKQCYAQKSILHL